MTPKPAPGEGTFTSFQAQVPSSRCTHQLRAIRLHSRVLDDSDTCCGPLSFSACLVSQIGVEIEILLAIQRARMAAIASELNFDRNHNDVAVGGGQKWGVSNADLAGENGPGLASAIVALPWRRIQFPCFYSLNYKLIYTSLRNWEENC